ncbi:hypothetical protein OIU79_016628 [Salix purpurea]|uniref:Ubiquitin-like domain-containing protein n=1 Tax=Salix purpurea TaxID=77065 RepID=A0A9Q0PEU7_SALPP|nr:hypothetical protein OIU79_016628 [Salix purpurea]
MTCEREHKIDDDQTLHSYGLQADHTIHMVHGFALASSPPAPYSRVTASNNENPGSNKGGPFGLWGADFRASLFPGLWSCAS